MKRADASIRITVRYDNRNFSVEGYKNTKLPRIFRMSYTEAGGHGLIIAIDHYKNGHNSQPRLYYDFDDVIKYIKRVAKRDGNYFLVGRQPDKEFHERVGGIKALDVPQELRNVKHLQHVIKRRQSAGSHEAFIEQQKKERLDGKIISRHGSLDAARQGTESECVEEVVE